MTPPLPECVMAKLLKFLKTNRKVFGVLGLLLVVSNPELRALIMLADAVGVGLLLLTMGGYLRLVWQTVVSQGPGVASKTWHAAVRGLQGIAMSRNVLTLGLMAIAQCRCLLALKRPA